jgi:hypothetical protein
MRQIGTLPSKLQLKGAFSGPSALCRSVRLQMKRNFLSAAFLLAAASRGPAPAAPSTILQRVHGHA